MADLFEAGQTLTATDLNDAVSGTPWEPLTLQNSWVNYGGSFHDAEISRIGNIAIMHGLIKNGTTTISTILTNVPAEYRPAGTEHLATASADSWCVIRVEADGNVRINGGANAGWISLKAEWRIA